MAEDLLPTTQQDALRELSDGLTSGSMSAYEVQVAMQHYPHLAEAAQEHRSELAGAGSEEELKHVLAAILAETAAHFTKLPAVARVKSEPVSAKEVAALAQSNRAAHEAATSLKKKAAKDMRSLIEQSVARYGATDSEGIMRRLTAAAMAAAEQSQTATEARLRVQGAVLREAPAGPMSAVVAREVVENADTFIPAWKTARAAAISEEIIVDNPAAPRLERAVSAVVDSVQAGETNKEIVREEALMDIRRAQVIDSPVQPSDGWKTIASAGGFFQSLPRQNIAQKALAPAVDVALAVFPPAVREQIVSGVLANSIERTVDKLTRQAGGAAFGEMRFAWGNKMMSADDQRASATGALSGIQKLFGDTIGAVFKAPLDETSLSYLNAIRSRALGAASWQQLYAYHAYPNHPGKFHLEFLSATGGWAVRLGAQKLIGSAVAGGAKSLAGEGLRRGAIGVLGKLGLTAAGGVATGGTSLLAQAALWAGGSLLGRIGRGIKSVFAGLAGVGGTNQSQTDWTIVIILAITVLIPMLFFFGGDISRTSSLVSSVGGELDEAGGSQFIQLSKTANPSSIPNNNPTSITYTIQVGPTNPSDSFAITSVTDNFSVYGKSTATLSSPNITPGDLADGSFSYTVPLGGQFQDSVITNTLTVVADVGGRSGETKYVSTSVIIGTPPTGCFTWGGGGRPDAYGHTSSEWDDKSGVIAAISQLARSPQYMAMLCGGGPISLSRVRASFGGGSVNSADNIFLYNAGVSGISAIYTLAHETGHILARRRGDIYGQFRSEGLYVREGPLWTYPNAFSEGEDFAETIGVYTVWRSYNFSRRTRSGRINYPQEYPGHYSFAQGLFGIEY